MGNIDRMIHLLIATTKYCSECYRMQGKKLLSVVILRLLERYVVGVTLKCQYQLSSSSFHQDKSPKPIAGCGGTINTPK